MIKPLATVLTLLAVLALCAFIGWPITVVQWAFTGLATVVLAIIVWAYFASPVGAG